VLNKRIKRALELRQKGLSFIKIGQELSVGSERARQIVRKYKRQLAALEAKNSVLSIVAL
jgi:orotate phosphoribosyltransferase-like protein